VPCASWGGLPKRMILTAGEPGARLTHRLLAWFSENSRSLPWRFTSDPYAIVVAEFMLHQTRVSTVLAYYDRFLQRFPSWEALARSSLDDVLKSWEGMGYYARARNLHRLARQVSDPYRGQLPQSKEALRALPGIGEYTAGAILSMVFGQDEPAIDGNVRRVLSRLFALTADPGTHPGRRQILQAARSLLPPGQAGTFNQALMDLGALICTPRHPACPACPWVENCLARQRGLQDELPIRSPSRPLPHYDVAAAVIWREGKILIAQRPPSGLLGGLWEFPGGKRLADESLKDCAAREVREELLIEIEVGPLLARIDHAYTHFRITLHAFTCRYEGGEPRAIGCTAWRWVRPEKLDQYAFPAANRRIIDQLRQCETGPADQAWMPDRIGQE